MKTTRREFFAILGGGMAVAVAGPSLAGLDPSKREVMRTFVVKDFLPPNPDKRKELADMLAIGLSHRMDGEIVGALDGFKIVKARTYTERVPEEDAWRVSTHFEVERI